MMPMRIPKASAHAAFIRKLRGRTGAPDLYGRLPSADRAVGFAEIRP
jgi:hypothetical protein